MRSARNHFRWWLSPERPPAWFFRFKLAIALTRFGAKAMLPAVIVFSLIKESGPVITALIVSGRVGAGIGAELGSMRVTEQIDAMEVSAVDPYKFLASTRVLACLLHAPVTDARGGRVRHLSGMDFLHLVASPSRFVSFCTAA